MEQAKRPLNAHELVTLGEFVSIKKHDNSKIRLGVSPAIAKVRFDLPEVMKQAKLGYDVMLQSFSGIQSVKVRLLILAVDIEYDSAVIPPTFWDELVNQTASPQLLAYLDTALAALLEHLSAEG